MTSLQINNPDPADRETLYSYLSRLAATWRTEVPEFAIDIGVPFRAILEQDQQALDALTERAELDACQMDEMLSWTGAPIGNARMKFRGESVLSRALRNPVIRGCPACLREDARQHGGPSGAAMVMRGDWQFREVNLCIRHSHPLVALWKAEKPRERNNISKRLEEIEADILTGRLDTEPAPPSAYDLWLDGRLHDGQDETWLKDHSLFSATTFMRLLGQTLLQESQPDHPELVGKAHVTGFEIVRKGPGSIRESLDRIAAGAIRHSDEPPKVFGAMFPALNSDYLEDKGFTQYRQILRDCILEHWPVAPRKVLLGEVVRERRLHSLVTAAKEIGVGPEVLEHHLVGVGAITGGGDRARSRKIFDPRAYADLLAEIPTLVGSVTLRRAMGATSREFKALIEENILVPRTRTPEVKHPWRLSDGAHLVDELRAKADRIAAGQDGWETLLFARQRTGLNLSMLIEAIRDDRLEVARREGADGFHGLVVPKAEVDSIARLSGVSEVTETDLPGEMSAAEFGRMVGLRDHGDFTALIEAGHTPAERQVNPKTGRAQYRLSADDIRAFHDRFVTLSTLARETGRHRNTIRALLAAAGVPRFTEAGKEFGPVYLRGEAVNAIS